jgi:hypothetical protein
MDSPVEGAGFEPSVPRQKDLCKHRDRCRSRAPGGGQIGRKMAKMPIWHRCVISAAGHPLRQIGQIGRVLRSPARASLDGNKIHGPPLFGVEQLVERSVPRIHVRGADRLDLLFGQLGGRKAAAAFAEALELLIFVRADEVAGDLAVGVKRTLKRAAAVSNKTVSEFLLDRLSDPGGPACISAG